MLYLLCNIVFASSFMLAIKWMHNRGREHIITVGTINYIVAFLIAIPLVLYSDATHLSPAALLTGGSMGLCYFVAFFFAIYAVRWIGAAGSTVISALSLVVPIICGAFIWNEVPNNLQFTGVLLALVSLMLIGTKKNAQIDSADQNTNSPDESLAKRAVMLLVFFAFCGGARLAQAAFKHLCPGEPSSHFTLSSFMMAAIPSLFFLLVQMRHVTRMEWTFGIIMGLANALQIQFIIKSLEHIDGFIVFPVTGAGALLLTTLVATYLLEEKLAWKSYVGIAAACLALFMLNS